MACADVSPLGAALLLIWLPKLSAQIIGTIIPSSGDLVLACRNGCGGQCYTNKLETPSFSLPKQRPETTGTMLSNATICIPNCMSRPRPPSRIQSAVATDMQVVIKLKCLSYKNALAV